MGATVCIVRKYQRERAREIYHHHHYEGNNNGMAAASLSARTRRLLWMWSKLE
jgi:hypothetical protein